MYGSLGVENAEDGRKEGEERMPQKPQERTNAAQRTKSSKKILHNAQCAFVSAALLALFLVAGWQSPFWPHKGLSFVQQTDRRRQAQALADQALARLNQRQRQQQIRIARNNETSPSFWTNKNSSSRFLRPLCESTLLLLRHCEDLGPNVKWKRDGSKHCSALGHQRAAFLATQFGNNDSSRWPAPALIYALSKGRNERQVEILAPLALASKTKIRRLSFPGAAELADAYLLDRLVVTNSSSDNLCGRVTVVAWKHAYLPGVAHQLGCGPDQGCPLEYAAAAEGDNDGSDDDDDFELEFDLVWQLKYVLFASENSNSSNHNNHTQWRVYGTVTRQHFDPLAFAQQRGT